MTVTLDLSLNLDVPDLAAAERFYVEALGFRTGRRLEGGIVELLGAAVPLYLLPKPPGTSASPAAGSERAPAPSARRRTYERHWTPLHLDVLVSDIVAARERALAAGALAEGEIEEHAFGRLALLADPFGHGLCLLELSAAGYDAIRAR